MGTAAGMAAFLSERVNEGAKKNTECLGAFPELTGLDLRTMTV